MKEEYLDGIMTVKHFLDDIELLSEGKNDVDYDFYKDNFEKLLFYISKSFLSDNFDYLFSNLDDEVANTVLKEGCRLNPEFKQYNPLAIYLMDNQYCSFPERLAKDPMLAYKVVRNKLCHYDYKINGDRIIIRKANDGENAEMSVASLVSLLCGTLSSYGQSTKKGAYDYWPLFNKSGNKSCLIMIKNIEDNDYSPSSLIQWTQYELITHHTVHVLSPRRFVDFIKKYVTDRGRYYVKKIDFEESIMKNAGIERISSQEELDLYMCAHDSIKCAGIAYNSLIAIVYSFYSRDVSDLKKKNKKIYSVLKNTAFISYMSLVFDDLFAKDFNGTIDSGLFIEKPKVEDKIIPWKFRNSLAHSRYRFENIFDSSGNIVIEFWDEDKNGINFECKITKDNAILLINDYLGSVS